MPKAQKARNNHREKILTPKLLQTQKITINYNGKSKFPLKNAKNGYKIAPISELCTPNLPSAD